jgi:hypothetical protein
MMIITNALLRRTSTLQRWITSTPVSSSNVPSIQIRINHGDQDNVQEQASSNNTATIHFQIEPRWSEEYELVKCEGGATTELSGDVNKDSRKLRINVHVPSDTTTASVVLAVPQRCHVTMMGSKTTNLRHEINVGGGSGRLEGDLRVYVPQGNILVHKSRGENVELRTANGGVHIKSVLEGLNADISSTSGFSAKRVMGENVTVRVSGAGGTGDDNIKGTAKHRDTDHNNSIDVAALYGGQFYLQCPNGHVNIDTAQVKCLDIRSGGGVKGNNSGSGDSGDNGDNGDNGASSNGIRVGGMSGTIMATAVAANSGGDSADVHVNFDQMFPVITGGGKRDDNEGREKHEEEDEQERSMLKADGSVHVSLSDATPFAVHVDMKSHDGLVTLPLDYSNSAIELGRQASASEIKTALFEKDEDQEEETNRVRGILRSAPKKKSRASNSGGSGKISMDAGNDLLDMKKDKKSFQGSLIVMAEKDVSVSIHGWMDRIRSKYLV